MSPVYLIPVWGLVGITTFGVLRELCPDEDTESHAAVGLVWPFVLLFFAGMHSLHGLSWLGRGPVCLVRYLHARAQKSPLPVAKVVPVQKNSPT